MAALEELDALRKKNRDLLEKLKKQSEKLHQMIISDSQEVDRNLSSVCEGFTLNRAPLKEKNGEQPPRASASTARKTIQICDEQLPADFENRTLDLHKLTHSQSSEATAYGTLLQDTGNSRWTGQCRTVRLMLPKSADLTADSDILREADRASTAGLQMETTSDRRMQPLLGYDWIAGLLDAESSLADRSEQFFSDLRSFRQVNRDECIHSLLSGLPSVADLASSTLDSEEVRPPADSHQCTFCYRVNSRLFAVPLDAQAACPVCKKPKSEHPHTETEPALIRVSIPRSTLLPAHKYKAHRRSSFDPSDSLGLPSHCLSGWSNPMLTSGSQMISLDLRSSMTKPAATGDSTSSCFHNKPDSYLPSGTKGQLSDQYQNVSRLPRYNFQHSEPKTSEPHSLTNALC
ncbi:migration and invasion-inhibitory protein isoform X2 [Danio rerio]|uniref:Migration and invasion-inhibitory protein n=1 Tax=Danio rerio TaxID=7955 RepID=A0A140LGU5_DANRE|nr:migration and invasion-inhibitory protein [Danio rerio]|eukprot:XP_689123.2 migration and invasion-inhibitory protein [Danio rerio]